MSSPMDGSPPDKTALRATLRARLRELDPAVHASRSEQICAWLTPRVAFGTILAFAPLPEEVNLWPLLVLLAASGRLVLPRVTGMQLTFHRVADLQSLRSGPLHLREPGEDSFIEALEHVDVALIPGLGFTVAGARLGRGRGLYDRSIDGLRPEVPRIGVGFAEQIVPELPMDVHDIWMTELVPAFR